MEYRYKTKSVQERSHLIYKIIKHHSIPMGELEATLNDIGEQYDWMEYPYICFTFNSVDEISLDLSGSGLGLDVDDVQEFMRLCGLDISYYGGLTIPKHKFI